MTAKEAAVIAEIIRGPGTRIDKLNRLQAFAKEAAATTLMTVKDYLGYAGMASSTFHRLRTLGHIKVVRTSKGLRVVVTDSVEQNGTSMVLLPFNSKD